jgi:hypothetical protein
VINGGQTTTLAGHALFDALETATNDILLTSPYLSMGVASRLSHLASGSAVRWRLLTSLDPAAAANGFLSGKGLRQMLDSGIEVASDRRLHAKVFLVDDAFALLGSANLTGSGLGLVQKPNLELSVRLPTPDIPAVRSQAEQWWSTAAKVDEDQLIRLEEAAKQLPRAPRVSDPHTGGSSQDVEQILSDARADGVSLWIKAQYGPGYPDHWLTDGWFSSSKKGKPSFKPGDLVLVYAKDSSGCYAVVEVTDDPNYDPDFVNAHSGSPDSGDRWPWVTRTSPRLVPRALTLVSLDELGVTPQGLQGGHVRLELSEFAAGVRLLAAAQSGGLPVVVTG